MIKRFVAIVTVLAGILWLAAGAWAFMDPGRLESIGVDARVWLKAAVLGLALLAIGSVAMAGARRIE